MINYHMTTPCDNCPFRSDIEFFLYPERVVEITDTDADFYCHKTTTAGGADQDGNESVCAGSMILREKSNNPSQMMKIAERLQMYDREKLNMNAPVYDSAEEMVSRMEDLHEGVKS